MKCDITVLTDAQDSSQVYHLNNLSLPIHLHYPAVGKGERIAGQANRRNLRFSNSVVEDTSLVECDTVSLGK